MTASRPSRTRTAAPEPPRQHGLGTGLRRRHLTMITLGGMIGAGLFVGSGPAIQQAGPGAILSYAMTAALVVLVMRMLSEMASSNPDTGSFSVYAERAYGRWAGFTLGWLYWWFWVVVLAVEATAGAAIVHGWFPVVPQWVFALAFMTLLTATNVFSVRSFGEFELWFSSIKVFAIIAFIGVGVAAIAGVLPSMPAPGLSNLVGRGGFLPHGFVGVLGAMVVMIFSFIGTEIVTIAAAESREPREAVNRAMKTVIWRLTVFYIGSIAVVVTLLPWNSASVLQSPYVAVLQRIGLPAAGTVMDVVVVTAVLSCLNSGIYTASRMAYSLALRGEAPRALSRTGSRGAPRTAILASVVVGFVAVVFNYVAPDTVFLFLLNSSGVVAIFVYMGIAAAQLKMRRDLDRAEQRPLVRMWLHPWLALLSLAAMAAIVVVMAVEADTRSQVLLSSAVTAVLVAVGVLRQRRSVVAGHHDPHHQVDDELGSGQQAGQQEQQPDEER